MSTHEEGRRRGEGGEVPKRRRGLDDARNGVVRPSGFLSCAGERTPTDEMKSRRHWNPYGTFENCGDYGIDETSFSVDKKTFENES